MLRSARAFALITLFAAAPLTACAEVTTAPATADKSTTATDAATSPAAAKAAAPVANTLPSGTTYIDQKVGTGAEAQVGKNVSVHYTGTLQNGTKFDSSLDRGQPFTFQLGAGEVIKGWDEGVAGMKVGGKRSLTIPAPAAYGARSPSPLIPPNSTLLFEVELIDVK